MTMDKYDEAIAFLLEDPAQFKSRVSQAWLEGGVYDTPWRERCSPGAALFQYASPLGCLTMIRSDFGSVFSPLELEIRADTRIPSTSHNIRPGDLEVFAEWQRRLDQERRVRRRRTKSLKAELV